MFVGQENPALNIAVANSYECSKSTCVASRPFAAASLRATVKDNEGFRAVSTIAVSKYKTHSIMCHPTTCQLPIFQQGHPRLLSQSGLPSHAYCLPYVPLSKQFLLCGNVLEGLYTVAESIGKEQ